MALASLALITVEKFKFYAKVLQSETSRTTEYEEIINESSQLIETYCGRFFREKTIIQKVDGDRGNYILTDQQNVTSVTSIHIDSARVFDANTLVDASLYDIDLDERQEGIGIVLLDSNFPGGTRNIRLEYLAGYPAITDVPADIQLACKITAAYYYYISENREFVSSSKSKGDETISIIQGIPERATLILDNYKRLKGY